MYLELSAFCSIFYQTHAGAINISEKYLVKPNNFAIFAPNRIVAIVLFVNKKVYMRFVGTHEEYNRIKSIKNI